LIRQWRKPREAEEDRLSRPFHAQGKRPTRAPIENLARKIEHLFIGNLFYFSGQFFESLAAQVGGPENEKRARVHELQQTPARFSKNFFAASIENRTNVLL